MLLIRRIAWIGGAALAIAALTAACGGGSGEKTVNPAGSATAASTRTATGTSAAGTPPSLDLRTTDLQSLPEVAALIEDSGGVFSQDQVLYADLTGDGVPEAIVPISSGGTMGNIAFIVLMADGDQAKTLLKEYPQAGQGLAVDVQDGKLIMTQPVPGPDDPLCCPSYLKHTTYAWNGLAMALESVTTDPNPNGGAKGTPSGPPPSDTTPGAVATQPPGVAPEGTAASGNRSKPPVPGASQ
jgi:hypothetical protein